MEGFMEFEGGLGCCEPQYKGKFSEFWNKNVYQLASNALELLVLKLLINIFKCSTMFVVLCFKVVRA